MTSPPGWVNTLSGGVPGAIAAYDFRNGMYWAAGTPSGGLSVTAPNTQYVMFSDGHVAPIAPGNLPVSDLGLSVWEPSSNLLTATNDFTNAAWTNSNMTAALNATGPDLVLNSASTLTATAGNATALQSVTHASSSQQASAFVKAVTVTGTINMTVDGGSTWHPITVGSGWTQVSIPQQTLANPSVGFQIVNSGDSIAVWCAQLESGLVGSAPTGPMPTGYTTRGLPIVQALGVPSLTAFSILAATGALNGTTGYIFEFNGLIDATATTTTAFAGGFTITATLGSGSVRTGCKRAYGRDTHGKSLAANGGAVVSDSHPGLIGLTGFLSVIGSDDVSLAANGYVTYAVIWPSRLPDATLQTLSTLP